MGLSRAICDGGRLVLQARYVLKNTATTTRQKNEKDRYVKYQITTDVLNIGLVDFVLSIVNNFVLFEFHSNELLSFELKIFVSFKGQDEIGTATTRPALSLSGLTDPLATSRTGTG
jgi:hypothetical protein